MPPGPDQLAFKPPKGDAACDVLAPRDAAGWARTTSWVFAALNSIEPHVQNFVQLQESRARVEPVLNARLTALAAWLGGKEYLEDRFTAGDLIMTTVLRELVNSGVLARFPTLDAYHRRCEARPAFGRAMEAQMKPFREYAPAAS